MDKVVVLAEKPSVGRDLARVLRCRKKGNGYLENEKYIVTWALGHLVTLADPEEYNKKYKSWRLEDLPILPDRLKLAVIRRSGRQFNIVKRLLQKKEVREIVLATDAGREGELVGRWILEKANVSKPVKRLWISSVTDKAIEDGFRNLKDGRQYENLYASAVARAEADWLVGINATRALTCKYNAQLSCGRVQTPTLAMIANREEEIKNFKLRTFYGIAAQAGTIKLVWQDRHTKQTRLFDKNRCAGIIASIQNEKAVIQEVKKTSKKSYAPLLYNLTELQREANHKFSFSAKETLAILQRLYENHKVLTYPRTDSRHISSDMVETLKERIKACGQGPYSSIAAGVLREPLKLSRSVVDDGKISDHHAIIPTEQPVALHTLSDGERKIYDLVVRRFLAALYPPHEYEQINIKATIGAEIFLARGKLLLQAGWKEVYEGDFADTEDDEKGEELPEQVLPAVKKGDHLEISAVIQTSGETKPPPLFNEGSLLAAMENPIKYMAGEKKELIKIIEESGGLGTVATRADIIEKLFNNFLIEKKGRDIIITSKGRQLLDLVPDNLKSPALTARWEQKLAAIARGFLDKETFVAEMRHYAAEVVREINNSRNVFKHDNLTRNRCPECGKYMLEVNGKKGKMLICGDRECGYRKGVARLTNARCPECNKRLELRGEGEGQIFVCPCGYREKLSAFQARKKNEQGKVSKREVANYLRKQSEQDLINPALAEALAKLKLK